ncbi:MAG: DUF4129 domain-containing protein [Maritimibacter sp.]|nr:DUF4129 domain-containing protein [Maritimibacter sp.]
MSTILVLGLALMGATALHPSPATAQAVSPEPLQIGPSGEAYLKALRYRRIDTDVAYYDPTRPAPEMELRAKVRDPEADTATDRNPQLEIGLPAALILLAIVALFLRYGGGLSVSFRRPGEPAARARDRGASPGAGPHTPIGLGAILAIADRRAALVALAEAALTRAVAAHGLLFQKSWTGRDVLRHLPEAAAHRDALRALVLASERAHFGGRAVSEDEFHFHLARIRPLIEEDGA